MAILVLALAVGASAQRKPKPQQVGSSVQLHSLTESGARGEVVARVQECRAGRVVHLFRQVAGRDDKMGSDKTDKAGDFVIASALSPGDYYVAVGMDRQGEFICGNDRSRDHPLK
jgi:hypothetical protein